MRTNAGLTPKQQKALDFIVERIAIGIPPTIREIAGELGFSSTGTVRDYLAALEKKGYLERANNKSRSMRLLKDRPFNIPIIADIPAGDPNSAYEDIQGYVDIKRMLSGSVKKDIFALKVKGDSMIEAGIMDGDIAIIRKQQTADNGDIIAALLENNEVTLKRLRRENNAFFLEASNAKYKPIRKDFTIIGKLASILRSYS